jgi:tetratricopeptide (TPR) repeat protein
LGTAMASQSSRPGRLLRLIFVALVSSAVLVAVLIASQWIGVFITRSIVRRATIAFLVGLEIAYVVSLVGFLAGTASCGALLWWAPRNRTKWQPPARGLLLCVSCLMAIGLVELTVGVRRSSSARADSAPDAERDLPDRFSEPARAGELTLAVLGESSASGFPFERRLSIGKILGWQLERAIPGQKVNVDVIAKPADTLKGQYGKLAGITRRPDVLIVYCGHNEFLDGVPWERKVIHYHDDRPPLLRRIDELAGRVSPVCSLIRETADRFRAAVEPARDRHNPLVDSPAYTHGEYVTRLGNFRRRMEAIAGFCDRIGTLAVFVVPPANDAGCEPNRSFLPAETPRAAREAFAREFLGARDMEKSNPATAVLLYQSLLESQPEFAETHFRLGRLLERAGAWDEAYEHFIKARDFDGLPNRCMTDFQNVCREVAARHDCVLVDGQALFHAIAPHGLLNDYLFQDGMHPSLRGHVALAQGVLDALLARRAWRWSSGTRAPRINIAECADHFGLSAEDWRVVADSSCASQYFGGLLRYDPGGRQAKTRVWEEAIKRLAAGEAPESIGLPNLGVPSDEPRGEPGETEVKTGSRSADASP